MNAGKFVRRLTGAAKNAVVWGATWSALAFATILGLRTIGVVVPAEIGGADAHGRLHAGEALLGAHDFTGRDRVPPVRGSA
jgi:hypothetical protein